MSPVTAQRTSIVTLHPCLLNAGNVKKMKWTVGKMKNVAQGRCAPGADVQKAWSLALAEQDVILQKNNAPLGSAAPKHKHIHFRCVFHSHLKGNSATVRPEAC